MMMMMITISLIFTPSLLGTTSIFQTATAAQPLSLPSSLESTTIKVTLSDSIQALKSGNTNKTQEQEQQQAAGIYVRLHCHSRRG